MNFYTIKPDEKLTDLVQYYWVYEGTATREQPFSLRTPANGFPELLFHYKGTFSELAHNGQSTSFRSGIHGQTNLFRQFTIAEDFGMIGVHFYPYAVKTFFGIPALEFTNQLPDLLSVLKPADRSLNQMVFEARTNNDRIKIISDFLESYVAKYRIRPEVEYAVKTIIKTNGIISMTKLAAECSISQRQFERTFKEHVGFTAKSFARIIRFGALMNRQASDFNGLSLTEIAYNFGYYDQSHFIHDFKEFSGYSPKTYFSGRAG